MRQLPCLFLVFVFATSSCDHPHKTLPNIVILYADDMGYGDLAIQNPEAKLTTPNLDQLAREGILFRDGHSSSGICTPSRFALLSGQYHWRRFHDIVGPFGPSVFKPGDLTLPEWLQGEGYTTACIGKWHLGWDWESVKRPGAAQKPVSETDRRLAYGPADFDWSQPIPGGPLDHGFDYYFGDGTINFPPYTFIENDRVVVEPSEPFNLHGLKTKEGAWEFRPGPMAPNWNPYLVLPTLMEKAVAWIDAQEGKKPFFLYLPFPSPHAPIIPADEFLGKTAAGAYGDYVYQTDFVAGEVLKAIDNKGFTENTLVVFTADNGPEYYAYSRIQNFDHFSMGYFRGLKRDLYEGGHRVPFVIKWPGKIKAGQVSDVLIHQVDLYRTLVAVITAQSSELSAQIDVTNRLDGVNQLPYLLGETSQALRTSAVQNTFADGFVMRKDEWLLIDRFSGYHTAVPDWYLEAFGYPSVDKDQSGELYNLSVDPSQKEDLYEQYPEKVAELRKALASEKSSHQNTP